MKRSEINKALKEMEAMIRSCRFELPPFCGFTPEEWQEKGYTTSPVNRDKLSNYSRKEQASQFARIFEEI